MATEQLKEMESPLSDIRSLMMAEEEMSSIFSKNKTNNTTQSTGWQMWSPNSSQNQTTPTSSNQNGLANFKNESGFSNYGHFEASLKRPSCNPLAKDTSAREMQNPLNAMGLKND